MVASILGWARLTEQHHHTKDLILVTVLIRTLGLFFDRGFVHSWCTTSLVHSNTYAICPKELGVRLQCVYEILPRENR